MQLLRRVLHGRQRCGLNLRKAPAITLTHHRNDRRSYLSPLRTSIFSQHLAIADILSAPNISASPKLAIRAASAHSSTSAKRGTTESERLMSRLDRRQTAQCGKIKWQCRRRRCHSRGETKPTLRPASTQRTIITPADLTSNQRA